MLVLSTFKDLLVPILDSGSSPDESIKQTSSIPAPRSFSPSTHPSPSTLSGCYGAPSSLGHGPYSGVPGPNENPSDAAIARLLLDEANLQGGLLETRSAQVFKIYHNSSSEQDSLSVAKLSSNTLYTVQKCFYRAFSLFWAYTVNPL